MRREEPGLASMTSAITSPMGRLLQFLQRRTAVDLFSGSALQSQLSRFFYLLCLAQKARFWRIRNRREMNRCPDVDLSG
jgi:hypothetical protein